MPAEPPRRRRVLILGGTAEALALADVVHARHRDRLTVITSLAGRIAPGRDRRGELRIGGFGGADGLARYLRAEAITAVVDATHPFAARISGHAADACAAAGVPRLMLVRPEWRPEPDTEWPGRDWPGGDWIKATDFADAAAIVARTARRAWLTTGPGALDHFAGIAGVWFLVRLFQAPEAPLPLAGAAVIVARPPFTVDDERRVLSGHGIDTLVTKNAGGPLAAKLEAARAEGVRVVMIARPPAPAGERVETVDDALAWIARRL